MISLCTKGQFSVTIYHDRVDLKFKKVGIHNYKQFSKFIHRIKNNTDYWKNRITKIVESGAEISTINTLFVESNEVMEWNSRFEYVIWAVNFNEQIIFNSCMNISYSNEIEDIFYELKPDEIANMIDDFIKLEKTLKIKYNTFNKIKEWFEVRLNKNTIHGYCKLLEHWME